MDDEHVIELLEHARISLFDWAHSALMALCLLSGLCGGVKWIFS